MPRHPEVDAWFEHYDNPIKPVVLRIREIVLDADPRIDECIKWHPKSRGHASLMFHLGARIPGHHPRLEGSGDTSRVMKIGGLDEAEEARPDLESIVRAWCAWREG